MLTHLPQVPHICVSELGKPLPEPMLTDCQFDRYWEQPSENSNQNRKAIIHENAFENVIGEMAAILSRVEMS